MIKIEKIIDIELNRLLQHFQECMDYVTNLEYPIKLHGYGYFLRLALNTLQNDDLEYIKSRLKNNKDLERNEGGYSIENMGDKNPKIALNKIINHLLLNRFKTKKINSLLSSSSTNFSLIADRNDVDFLKSTIRNVKVQILTNQELKKKLKLNEIKNNTIVFYSFNGLKDFDCVYNLQQAVLLVIFEQEAELYEKQLQLYKEKLENEISSNNRYDLCEIKYIPIIEQPIKVNPTLGSIITRLDERSGMAYDGYKNESDSLLDELEEQINYKLKFSNGSSVEMESNETVFDDKGNLIKGYKLRVGDKIRIYPKEQLAENLLQIAIESEPEIFGQVEIHAKLWLDTLKYLDKKYLTREQLYSKLKEKGLRVLPQTVDAYFKGCRKYPMFNRDLKAIIQLSNNEELINKIPYILKSKRLYISTMIALGRGIKQELKQFLKENIIGELLIKRSFTKATLQKFIEEQMPLVIIKDIQTISYEQEQ
jgi:hypothetical protein